MLKQIEAKYTLFDSVESMLSPDNLSNLLMKKVADVTCQPFDAPDRISGSQMYNVTADDQRLVMKKLSPTLDWKSIASKDHNCRSVTLWQYGLLDRIQPHMNHATLAACRDGEDYAILMRDVSEGLFYDKEITEDVVHTLLEALAEVHAMFWEDDTLQDPKLGLADAETLIPMCWSINWDRFNHDPNTVSLLKGSWDALFELLEPDTESALKAIMGSPQGLFDAVAKYPRTLIHADYRTGNLALLPKTNQVIAFDWQDASYAPATICLSWFIMSGAVFMMQDAAGDYYRQYLSKRLGNRFDQTLWQEMYEVGCLVEVLRKGGWHALFAKTSDDEGITNLMRQSVASYNDIIRKGLKWL